MDNDTSYSGTGLTATPAISSAYVGAGHWDVFHFCRCDFIHCHIPTRCWTSLSLLSASFLQILLILWLNLKKSLEISLRQTASQLPSFWFCYLTTAHSSYYLLIYITFLCTEGNMLKSTVYSFVFLCRGFFSGMRPYLLTVHIVYLGTHRGNCILFTLFSKLFFPNFFVWMANHHLWNCVYDHLICLWKINPRRHKRL